MMKRLLAGIVMITGLTAQAHAQEKNLRVCFGEYDAPRADKAIAFS